MSNLEKFKKFCESKNTPMVNINKPKQTVPPTSPTGKFNPLVTPMICTDFKMPAKIKKVN